jgi:hypothetical protein
MYVNNEYTANKLIDAGARLGVEVIWQWVRTGRGLVIACDFLVSKNHR